MDQLAYKKKKSKEEMKHQLMTFFLMILFTIMSFSAVGFGLNPHFVVPFILLLACVQVVFQLHYFMHMKEKGHTYPIIFMYTGVFFAFIFNLAFLNIIWW